MKKMEKFVLEGVKEVRGVRTGRGRTGNLQGL